MNFFFFLLFSINYNLSASNIKIAIIDHTKVRIQPKEAIEIRKKIDELVVKFQKDILAQEADLRTEYDLLINDKNMKDTKDYDKKRQAFKAKLSKVQLLSRNNKRKVEIAYKVAIEKFSKKFTTVLTQFQKDEEIDIILKKENILFYKEELDKTAELLKRIDAVYSEVVIEINDKEADDK